MSAIRNTLMSLGTAAAIACGTGDVAEPAAGDAPPRPAHAVAPAAESGNRAPVIDGVALDPESPRSGGQLAARVSASDPDGDDVEISYRWAVGGKRLDATGPFLSLDGVERAAVIELTVVASDGRAESAPQHATTQVGNTPPRVDRIVFDPEGELGAEQDLVATPEASDPEGDPIEYRYLWFVDGERVADAEGATLGASHYARGDSIELEVVASDGVGEGEPLRSEPIRVANTAPHITSTPGAIGKDGVFRYAVAAEDADGDSSFRFRLLQSPEGMTIGFDDGRLVWQPGAGAAGNHPVEVEVSDVFGGRSTQLFELRLSYAEPAAPASSDDDEE